ncbi:MAG TPA: hypothetical protein VFS40_07135 [Gemmatimonadales bacterium]|nr:hypothetical protein [Gemmatimonadales bacterium]
MPDDFPPDSTPEPTPGTAIVHRRSPRLGALLRQAVSLALDAADELAERARQALGLAP